MSAGHLQRTILITGATDGIGKLTAQRLVSAGHRVLLHGRNPDKLAAVASELGGDTESYTADLSRMWDVKAMADQILERHTHLDVLINNAGVLKTANLRTADGLDVRFVVNTLSPYVLTQRLLPILGESGRIVNLSSAAQAPVNLQALAGATRLDDMAAYAQSKLAITIWTRELAKALPAGPSVVAVNPGSLLGTKMVKEGFGMPGKDVGIGADVLVLAALDDSFVGRSGQYFDNDNHRFADPNPAALNAEHSQQVMQAIETLVAELAPAE
jgi:NAD(P)-dependent dehydrogenase (short-subunit alcohol dehydrogenase family)